MEGDEIPSKDTENRAQQTKISGDYDNERQLHHPSSDVDYVHKLGEASGLDENLEDVANRNNLTVTNVKNILHVSDLLWASIAFSSQYYISISHVHVSYKHINYFYAQHSMSSRIKEFWH